MKAKPYFVSIKTDKGRRTNVAYIEIRLRSTNILAEQLAEEYMKDFLAHLANTSNASTPENAVLTHKKPPGPIPPNYTSTAMMSCSDQ